MLKYQGPYRSDSDFAAYLISLEMRRRERREPKVSATISFVSDLRPKAKAKASMYVLVLFSFCFDLLKETFESKEGKMGC